MKVTVKNIGTDAQLVFAVINSFIILVPKKLNTILTKVTF